MPPRPLIARRQSIIPDFFPMAEIDPGKVRALVAHLRAGGRVPPVVAAIYGTKSMPLDGHHRLSAWRELGLMADAWTVSGKAFDRLCTLHPRAEELVLCGGTPAMLVAERWSPDA